MRPILITGGATQNPIDAMRCITAYATGNTAITLAQRLCSVNKQTFLFCSQMAQYNALHRGYEHQTHTFSTTRDLQQKMHDWLYTYPTGIVIHSAAVGDYEVADEYMKELRKTKISSNQSELIIKLQPAPKILSGLKTLAPSSKIVSFKAAAPDISNDEMIQIAKGQLNKSNSDLVFANQIGQTHQHIALVSLDSVQNFVHRKEAIQRLFTLIQTWMLEDSP